MLLAIDTSTEMLGLALHDGHRILWESERYARMRHTVELAPAVEEMLRGTGGKVGDLSAMGIALGPGSFTAVRIGLAFAIGMAQVRMLPLVGIPTLDILAAGQPPADDILVAVLRVGRGRVAMAEYSFENDAWRAQTDPRAVSWPELAEQVREGARVCGEIDKAGYAALEKRKDLRLAPAHLCVRRAGVLADLAQKRLREAPGLLPPIRPIYLNSPSVPTD
jgi:tRNA threonylcarbamoyladenosine biosynthesis protein TsaB